MLKPEVFPIPTSKKSRHTFTNTEIINKNKYSLNFLSLFWDSCLNSYTCYYLIFFYYLLLTHLTYEQSYIKPINYILYSLFCGIISLMAFRDTLSCSKSAIKKSRKPIFHTGFLLFLFILHQT